MFQTKAFKQISKIGIFVLAAKITQTQCRHGVGISRSKLWRGEEVWSYHSPPHPTLSRQGRGDSVAMNLFRQGRGDSVKDVLVAHVAMNLSCKGRRNIVTPKRFFGESIDGACLQIVIYSGCGRLFGLCLKRGQREPRK